MELVFGSLRLVWAGETRCADFLKTAYKVMSDWQVRSIKPIHTSIVSRTSEATGGELSAGDKH